MSDRVAFSLQIEAPNDTALENWAIAHLQERGFSVRAPNQEWETAGAFCRRLQIHNETLRRHAERTDKPNVLLQRGTVSGKLVALLSNPDFDVFVTRNKKRRNRESDVSHSR